MIQTIWRRAAGSLRSEHLAFGLLILAVFLFGGASRENALRLALVELSSLPLLVIAAARCIRDDVWTTHRFSIMILAGLIAIPLISVVPLPPEIWTELPGRDQLALGLSLSGLAPGWAPLSMTPDLTWRAILALFPPIAIFLAVLAFQHDFARKVLLASLLLGLCGLALGILQLASASTQFYFWSTTDAGNVAGFFANRNHMATLCLVGIPFAILLAVENSTYRTRFRAGAAWAGFLYVAIAIVAIGAIRSRAGILLVAPVTLLSLVLGWGSIRRVTPAILAVLTLAVISIGAVGSLALRPILSRFNSGAPEGRFENWPTIADSAQAYLPWGSGTGSFDAVYRSVEPLARLDSTFFNHAHNEYLEIWLENGIFGAFLLAAFLLWFARRVARLWASDRSLHRNLQMASAVAVLTVLVHSGADYPLRTETMAVLFALFCGVLELSPALGQPRAARVKVRRRSGAAAPEERDA